MSTFRSDQIQQPVSLTGSLFGTASYALTSGNIFNTSSLATTGSNTFIGDQTITGSINLIGTINGVGQLTQILTQTNTSAPVATTLTNTTGVSFTWSYISSGWYRVITNNDLFLPNKCLITFTPGYAKGTFDTGNDYIIWYEVRDYITLDIFVKQVGGNGANNILYQAGFDVKAYP